MNNAQIKTQTLVYGILGILLLGGAGVIFLTPEQLANARTCTTNNITGIFEKFSSTNATAYWTVDGIQKQTVCTKGKWIPTIDWLKINNLTEKDISIGPIEESIVTEDNVEIVLPTEKVIYINQSKRLSIGGVVYNISYDGGKETIRCICEKSTGCKLQECIG